MASQPQATGWLVQNGPKELEVLFRAIIHQPAASILVADDNRKYRDASSGATKLLGLPREKIIGRDLDDFAESKFKPLIPERWQAFLEMGEQHGTLPLLNSNGDLRNVEYSAKGKVLPSRHILVLHEKASEIAGEVVGVNDPSTVSAPRWAQDYALFLMDTDGAVAAWYAGAERIYGYKSGEMLGKTYARCYPGDDGLVHLGEELNRSAAEGHFGAEGWHVRRDGTRFWANSITMALKDENGELQGFARVVRDFSNRHERDEKLRRSRIRPIPPKSAIAGIVSGEFDQVPEANDAFLEMVGYSREDLARGQAALARSYSARIWFAR